jgi:hypothetical protein
MSGGSGKDLEPGARLVNHPASEVAALAEFVHTIILGNGRWQWQLVCEHNPIALSDYSL